MKKQGNFKCYSQAINYLYIRKYLGFPVWLEKHHLIDSNVSK